MSKPRRQDYASDADFLDAMAKHHGIDPRMLKHIPMPFIPSPKMSHDDDTCPHLVIAGRLEAENARLKAEVERLTKAGDAIYNSMNEIAWDDMDDDDNCDSWRIAMNEWNAAKEGKQP